MPRSGPTSLIDTMTSTAASSRATASWSAFWTNGAALPSSPADPEGHRGADRPGARRRQDRRRSQERRRASGCRSSCACTSTPAPSSRPPGAHHRLRWRPRKGLHQGARPRLRHADARAGAQSPRAILGRGRRPLVRTRAAADRAPPTAGQSVPRPARRQAHREQGDVQRRRPEAHHRLGGVGRFQARADHGRRIHHPEAHQSGKLLAGRDRRTPLERAGVRGRRLGRARRGSEELLAVVPRVARSAPRDRSRRRPARLALVARSARDGSAALRHPGARSGFQLRRCAARLQHAARRGAHQRNDAVPHRRRAGEGGDRDAREARAAAAAPGGAAGAHTLHQSLRHLEPAGPVHRREEGARRPVGCGVRLLSQGSGAAALVRLLEFRRRDAPARWRAPRVALRHRRLRLGQHRTGHRPVALVHLPAHRPRRRRSAWRRP